MKKMEQDLLDALAKAGKLEYLSDLRCHENWRSAVFQLRNRIDEFSLEQWEKAAVYLTLENKHFDSAQQAWLWLMDWNRAAEKKK